MKRRNKMKVSILSMAFGKVNAWIEKRQRKFSDYLNQRCEGFSTKQLTVGLIGFCLLFGSTVAFTIWHSLESFGSRKVATISIPKHIAVQNTNELKAPVELEAIKIFRKRIDSLQATASGLLVIDSIKMTRPGLLESLKVVENMYQLKSGENEK